jgi:uncharacterized damage-inducible protein DinB
MPPTVEITVDAFGRELVRDAKVRLVDESLPRILKCLEQLTEDEIWFRPNGETVSIGNLVIHLCGNVRQWIISTFGGVPDKRTRQAEFDERGPIPTAELIKRITATVHEAARVLDNVDAASLLEPRNVQGEVESGISIIVHVVEHFSYHTGQITYAVKSRKNVDLAYYGGRNLDVTGS